MISHSYQPPVSRYHRCCNVRERFEIEPITVNVEDGVVRKNDIVLCMKSNIYQNESQLLQRVATRHRSLTCCAIWYCCRRKRMDATNKS